MTADPRDIASAARIIGQICGEHHPRRDAGYHAILAAITEARAEERRRFDAQLRIASTGERLVEVPQCGRVG